VPIQAIQTSYRGYRFRSRLEARWAVFLDFLHIQFDYEPEGVILPGNVSYLPDFWLPQVEMWAEVKPNNRRDSLAVTNDALYKAAQLAMASGHPVVFFDAMPRDTNYWALWPDPVDPIGWEWIDVVPSESNAYHLDEHRFYASSGGAELAHDWPAEDSNHPAVVAARSARFERGE
jgi:hypothetical protein